MLRLVAGTPLAQAVSRALSAQRTTEADTAYGAAVELADGATAAALAGDHVANLVRRQALCLALRRCTEHLASFPGDRVLLLTRAEVHCSLAQYPSAGRDADAAGSVHGVEHQARMHRVRGLVAADRGDGDAALRELEQARALFAAAGHDDGVAVVDRALETVHVRRGEPSAVQRALSAAPPQNLAERFRRAWVLRREGRYEEALWTLEDAVEVDPALRPVLRDEVTRLRWLTREQVDGAAMRAGSDATHFGWRLHDAHIQAVGCRMLVAKQRPAEAAVLAEESEASLDELRPRARTAAEQATWHLVAGELELSCHDLLERAKVQAGMVEPAEAAKIDPMSALHEAAGHFRRAAHLADTTASAESRLLALRLLGRVQTQLSADEEASEFSGAAHRIEEGLAARQRSDEVKVRMLAAASDEHDERVTFAAEAIDKHGPDAAAVVAVAIESARGQTLTDAPGSRRPELPRLTDIAGAKRWVRDLARDLPRSQMAWLMHATSDRVHHVMVGRTMLHHYATPKKEGFRNDLVRAVGRLELFCDNPDYLEGSVGSGEFEGALADIVELLDIGPVLERLPSRVAVVAHGVLTHVPIAALPVPGTDERLVHRFAVSDLPSLSARRPLAHRAVHCRGARSLLVRPDLTLAPAADQPGRTTVLKDGQASVDRLRQEVPGHHIVRVESHGTFAEDDAWLQLAPDGPDGWLRPRDLRSMDLRGCGTVILGACESGMARSRGRDEPVGFVRSVLRAGAAAVAGARWIADDTVSAHVLNRFEDYLRYLPRDVALQRAQLDVCADRTSHTGASGQPVKSPGNPARWGCWTLYGDAGWQTSAGPVRRWRASRDQRSRREP